MRLLLKSFCLGWPSAPPFLRCQSLFRSLQGPREYKKQRTCCGDYTPDVLTGQHAFSIDDFGPYQ